MIEVVSLTKRYGSLVALDEVSLSVEAGEFLVVLGPSGAGKSTLLRCINRLIEPDHGDVRLDKDVVPARGAELRRMRAQIGMIFQDHNLVPRLSVLKNVLTGRLSRLPLWSSILQLFDPRDMAIALACLRRVELEDRAWNRADRLSGGQQQRVGIARALAQEPRLILADEPVASLDPKTARIVLDDLRRASRELRIAVICNLHQVQLAFEFADRIVGMRAGRIVFEGKPSDLDADAIARIYPGLQLDAVELPARNGGRTDIATLNRP
ncbi:MAG TPA: phosphonate ABC transporter ATP-binding protein [Burkholderiales bacterium]|nr:phosphonate ABC transporter ATP-binding protein [Burkholderiales bacterium]